MDGTVLVVVHTTPPSSPEEPEVLPLALPLEEPLPLLVPPSLWSVPSNVRLPTPVRALQATMPPTRHATAKPTGRRGAPERI
jgi:hypothetical protein